MGWITDMLIQVLQENYVHLLLPTILHTVCSPPCGERPHTISNPQEPQVLAVFRWRDRRDRRQSHPLLMPCT